MRRYLLLSFCLLTSMSLAGSCQEVQRLSFPAYMKSVNAENEVGAVGGNAAAIWGDCYAQAIDKSLEKNPNILKKVTALRKDLIRLNYLGAGIDDYLSGGRSTYEASLNSVAIQEDLGHLAALYTSYYGVHPDTQFAEDMALSRKKVRERIKEWNVDFQNNKKAGTLPYRSNADAFWKEKISAYEAVSTRLFQTLGTQPNYATAFGYRLVAGLPTSWSR